MKISCVQMDMLLGEPEKNFSKAENLFNEAVKSNPDTVVFPETWNTGFFPHENLKSLSDSDGKETKKLFSGLASENRVNIVAGSVANLKDNNVYNTSFIFDRDGKTVAQYDKTHLFTPMGEHGFFKNGVGLVNFELDGRTCGIIICYDVRFPELTRTLTLQKRLDCLFIVSQWPETRISQLHTLVRARAVENQMFAVCCNSCGKAGDTVFGGQSVIYSPLGEELAKAGAHEEIISAECDFAMLGSIRSSIDVFADRREELYRITSEK